MKNRGLLNSLGLCACAVLIFAVPAQADVKEGVDLWEEGKYADAVREWVIPAQNGDPDAQFNLAQAYRLGRGVDIDKERAEALYELAAEQGHLRAADNYALMLFQRGERAQAMPYIESAASRGDPRSQYLLGISHFNGDLVEKDWPRAYALLTLANGAGLPQAVSALAQMDEYIPLAERESAQRLAAKLKAEADAARARELAAVDLALGAGLSESPEVQSQSVPSTAPETGKSAGADFTGPRTPSGPVPPPAVVAATTDTPVNASEAQPATGPWKVQLGAFGVAGNADRLWNRLSDRSELSGREKLKRESGRLTFLFAAGFATRDEAARACTALKRSGQDCLVTK